jgi:RNA polymerase sigma factor (TIGR02999 family)
MAQIQRKDNPERLAGRPRPKVEECLNSASHAQFHKLAICRMCFERVDNTLQRIALVREAYLRLAEATAAPWEDREHSLAVAVRIMRHILVNQLGAGALKVDFDENPLSKKRPRVDVLIVDEGPTRLSPFDARLPRILESHSFAGITSEDIGAVRGVSCRTAKFDWSMARAWPRVELSRRK